MALRWRIVACVGAIALGLVGCNNGATSMPQAPEKSTSSAHLAQQDDAYVAYRNTHEHSSKIPTMIVDLARMHLQAKEYLLARFYCDEYRRDFPSGKRRIEVEYLRLKALFLRYSQGHDSRVAEQARGEASAFLSEYRRTPYRAKVKRLLAQMRREENGRYEELAKYYEGRGKPKAAAFYRKKIIK